MKNSIISSIGARLDYRLALALMSMTIVAIALFQPHREGDTAAMIQGVHNMLACQSKGSIIGCPYIYAFPLYQYLPTAVFIALGIDDPGLGTAFAGCSALALAAMVAIFVRQLPDRRVAAFASLTLLASPLVFYARSTFNEPVHALFLLLMVVEASGRGRWAWLFLWTLLAGICKETVHPFLLMLLATAILSNTKALRRQRWVLGLAGFASTAFSMLVNAGFNYVRTRTWYNTSYLITPGYNVRDSLTTASSFFGHFLSPSAGMLWFWPLALLVCVEPLIATGIDLKRLQRTSSQDLAAPATRSAMIHWLLDCVPSLVLVMYAGGLSLWWSPFGWLAYGDRLMYPLIPACLYLILWRRGEAIVAAVRRWHKVAWGVLAGLVLLSSMTHYSMLVHDQVLGEFFLVDPNFDNRPVEQDPVYYRTKLRYQTWKKPSIMLQHWGSYHRESDAEHRSTILLLGAWLVITTILVTVAKQTRPPALAAENPGKTDRRPLGQARADP